MKCSVVQGSAVQGSARCCTRVRFNTVVVTQALTKYYNGTILEEEYEKKLMVSPEF